MVAGIIVLAAFLSLTVAAVTVEPLMASLKLAIMVVPVLTPVAPFIGDTDVTAGGVRSTATVVNVQL